MTEPAYVPSEPYRWPFDGKLTPANTVLIVIDMQTDFCGMGGYVDRMGYDLSLTRAPIAPIQAVLAAMRAKGYHIIHTREGHRPDLSDLPENKRWRSGRSAPASVTTVPAGASSCAANPDGKSFPNWRRSPANRSSTNRARDLSAPPTSN